MTDYYAVLTDKEATYGTDPTTNPQEYRVRNLSLGFKPTDLPVRTVESGVQVQRKERIAQMSQGSVGMYVLLNKKWARWLAMLMGSESYSLSNTSVGNHALTFKQKITNASAWPSFTLQKGIGIEEREYNGVFATKGVFNQPDKGLLEASFDLVGKTPTASQALQSLSAFSTQSYLSSAHITTQTVGGSNVIFEGFKIEIDGPAMPAFGGSSKDILRADIKPASVKFSGNIRFLSSSHLDDFINGTKRAIVIKYTGDDVIAASSPSTKYSLQFDIYNLLHEDADIAINEQQRLVQVIGGELEEDASGNLFKITIQDETTSAYV